MTEKQNIGKWGEEIAIDYLEKAHLKIITTNFHSRFGEIDIIARDNDTLVFVEVRVRAEKKWGNALESITYAKQQKIRKTIDYYLIKYPTQGSCRIDAIGIDSGITPPIITWIKNAF